MKAADLIILPDFVEKDFRVIYIHAPNTPLSCRGRFQTRPVMNTQSPVKNSMYIAFIKQIC